MFQRQKILIFGAPGKKILIFGAPAREFQPGTPGFQPWVLRFQPGGRFIRRFQPGRRVISRFPAGDSRVPAGGSGVPARGECYREVPAGEEVYFENSSRGGGLLQGRGWAGKVPRGILDPLKHLNQRKSPDAKARVTSQIMTRTPLHACAQARWRILKLS